MVSKIQDILIIIIIILGVLFSGCIENNLENNKEPPVETVEDIAVNLMYNFANGTIDEIYNDVFTDEIKQQASLDQFILIWNQITGQYGDFVEINNIKTTNELGYIVVYVTCYYSVLGNLDTRIVFNSDNKISGLQFVPTDVSSLYKLPSYSYEDNFNEHNITIGGDTSWPLPATLTIPNGGGPYPVVILVHGSGPNDRDETIGPNKPFKDMAWGLATNDIAVLRYEKRTKYYADTIVDDLTNFTVYEETIDDAISAVNFLKEFENIDSNHIYILGHSLGGMLAPRIGTETSDIAGLIMLAAPARPLEDLILDQTIYLSELDGNISESDQKQIDLIQENVTKIKNLNISDDEIIIGAGFSYWADLSNYNQISTAQSLSYPMLLLQGKRDYQVLYEKDFLVWQSELANKSNVTFISYDSLNHLFISGYGTPTNSEYFSFGNVDEQVIIDISNWIKSKII